MANTTIYPYGVGGQLPSSIGVINDLVTGGADKALSAEQGKNLKIALESLRTALANLAYGGTAPKFPWDEEVIPEGDISNYVQNGLVFHLDGINKGNNSDAWTDLIGGVDFPNHGASAEEKGWDLDGQSSWLGYDTNSYNLPFSMENCTIEVCFYDKAINQGTGVPGSTAFLCSFGSQSDAGTNQTNGAYVNLCDSSDTKYINGCYLDGTTNVYADSLVDSVAANTLSINKGAALHNGQALSSLGRNHWANVKGGRLIGVQNHTRGKQNYFNGKIYAIRVYNRILTPAEMLHNQHVDNARFNLDLFNNSRGY